MGLAMAFAIAIAIALMLKEREEPRRRDVTCYVSKAGRFKLPMRERDAGERYGERYGRNIWVVLTQRLRPPAFET
jgi:hypothetical protein